MTTDAPAVSTAASRINDSVIEKDDDTKAVVSMLAEEILSMKSIMMTCMKAPTRSPKEEENQS
jgi:hypothetical protein